MSPNDAGSGVATTRPRFTGPSSRLRARRCIQVTTGTTVTWHNDDNFTHDVRPLLPTLRCFTSRSYRLVSRKLGRVLAMVTR